MATLTGARATDNFPIGGWGEGTDLKVSWGTYTLAANPSQNDVIRECWIPKNGRVIGGWIYAKDIDTGTEALDLDFGWEANGDEVADIDGFGNFGTWDGDAVNFIKPEVGTWMPLGGVLITDGFKKFNANTRLSFTVNAAANSFVSGHISVAVFYVLDY